MQSDFVSSGRSVSDLKAPGSFNNKVQERCFYGINADSLK